MYDLSAIFKNIRAFPSYELNNEILIKIINILKNKHKYNSLNIFRTALNSISFLDKEKFYFVFTENIYTYFPTLLKDNDIYTLLIKVCENLLTVINSKNLERISDLADCLHNLPTDITENKLSIPKDFWELNVKYYRKKWDKNFLVDEEKELLK